MKHADNKQQTLLIRWSSFSLSPSSWLISSASILRIWGFLPSQPMYLCLVLSCIPPLSFFGYFLVKYFVP
jgi:hypothetical protein